MGDTTAPRDGPGEGTATPETDANGSRREALAAILRRLPGGRAALVVVLLLVMGSVWGVTGRQAGKAIEVTQGDLTCTGTKLATRPAGDEDAPTPTMWLQPGMRCILPVHLSNKGAFGVSLTSLRLPLMGSRGGAAVEVTHVGQLRRRGSDVDGHYPLSRSLAAGEELTLRVVFEFRKGGCNDAGDGFWIESLPEVGVRALGIGSTVRADGLVAFRGTAASTCSD